VITEREAEALLNDAEEIERHTFIRFADVPGHKTSFRVVGSGRFNGEKFWNVQHEGCVEDERVDYEEMISLLVDSKYELPAGRG